MKPGSKLAFAGMLAVSAASFGAAADDVYRMTTSSQGTAIFVVMTTLADIVNEQVEGMEIEVEAGIPGSRQAITGARGESDFFFTSPGILDQMLRREAPFQDIDDAPDLAKGMRALFNYSLGVYQMVTRAESGISSLSDLRGKRLFLGPPGGAATAVASSMIEAATGMKPGEDYELVELPWNDGAAAFMDQRVDVYCRPTLAPYPVIEEFAQNHKIRLIGLTEAELGSEAIQALLAGSGRTLGVVPAGVYGENQLNETAVTALGSVGGLGTTVELPEEVAYAVTKAFWEGKDKLDEPHPWLAGVSLGSAFESLNMPLHTGAVRYYREIGLTMPETAIAD